MFAKTRAVHQKLAVLAPVLFGVLNTDGCKALANGSSAFVSSENSFARGRDGSGGGAEFSSKLGSGYARGDAMGWGWGRRVCVCVYGFGVAKMRREEDIYTHTHKRTHKY
jgi:hypothetical protein